jgi:hypothetical protein
MKERTRRKKGKEELKGEKNEENYPMHRSTNKVNGTGYEITYNVSQESLRKLCCNKRKGSKEKRLNSCIINL